MVQPDDKECKQKAQISEGQCRQIIGRTAQFQVRSCEHEEAERVAHHTEDDDHCQVVKIEKIQANLRVSQLGGIVKAPVIAGRYVADATVVHSTDIVTTTFTHISNNTHWSFLSATSHSIGFQSLSNFHYHLQHSVFSSRPSSPSSSFSIFLSPTVSPL